MHVRFLCAANSIRSQMAEGAFRHLAEESFSTSSAGLFAHRVDESAIKVMREEGIDISSHKSKAIDDEWTPLPPADLVVDFTQEALHRERFKSELSIVYLNTPVYDPVSAKKLPEDERLPIYRYCRDEIFKVVKGLLTILRLDNGLEKLRNRPEELNRMIYPSEGSQAQD